MVGKRKPQATLFDIGNVFDIHLDPTTFYGQLAGAATRLFQDEEFVECYSQSGKGRPSTPPSQMALMVLLKAYAGCSDEEAVERSAYDLRWCLVLGKSAGEPLCVKSTLQVFRAQLDLHDKVRLVLQRSIQEARRAGLLKPGTLRVAVDTKPILGRGAVKDTYNLLDTGIRKLCQALAETEALAAEAWAGRHDLARYYGNSLKGGAGIDWSDEAARNVFLTEVVTDARRLLRQAGARLPALGSEERQRVMAAADLLERLLLQAVEESGGSARIRDGHEKGRLPSASDEEVRHGRKSSSKVFDGHKASVVTDTESGIVLGAEVLAGDDPDATRLLEQVEEAEANSGAEIGETVGDCAYGSGETRQEFQEAERLLTARVPGEGGRPGMFPKSLFVLGWEAGAVVSVTCPGRETTWQRNALQDGTQTFKFGERCRKCVLRKQCTTAAAGRTVRVHAQEALIEAARERQRRPEGREALHARVAVEHALARLAGLGIGQARYFGRRKTRAQLVLAASVANLRRVWNWEQAVAREESGNPGRSAARGVLSGALKMQAALAASFSALIRRVRTPRPLLCASAAP
jgi:hypothetical protein